MQGLVCLKELDLWDNQLSQLDNKRSLDELASLKALCIGDNRFSNFEEINKQLEGIRSKQLEVLISFYHFTRLLRWISIITR